MKMYGIGFLDLTSKTFIDFQKKTHSETAYTFVCLHTLSVCLHTTALIKVSVSDNNFMFFAFPKTNLISTNIFFFFSLSQKTI